ncbi:unnamed protein product [Linum tenue]|uniref:Uncharacterized protein n=1 Tax=Linum tenue TaxID=586396 RepID=A0AAV0MYD3_9ROSI|nr:unnamed protein product [Linum tenue]
MGEEKEDPQKIKRIAAAAYDYENDPRWADYWSNILIPPHMASRADVVDHFKRKFYQRYIVRPSPFLDLYLPLLLLVDPDLVVEAMSSTGSSQSTKSASGSSSSPSRSSNEQPRQRSTGSTTTNSGATPTATQNPTSVRWDRQTIQFSVNAWVFVVAVLAIFPIVPRSLSNRAYLALIPILCRALLNVAKFLRRNFNSSSLYRRYLEDPCVWVESNTTTLSILSSHAEIGVGFLLVLSLFSWQRNIIQTFMYWQLLKLMYHAPVTAGYHQSGWAKIGRSVNPLVSRYCPFLQGPISAVQKWWLR